MRAGGSRGGEGMGGGGDTEFGESFFERFLLERERSDALARFMAARVAEPELLREPGER